MEGCRTRWGGDMDSGRRNALRERRRPNATCLPFEEIVGWSNNVPHEDVAHWSSTGPPSAISYACPMSAAAMILALLAAISGAGAAVFQSRGARSIEQAPPNVVRLLLLLLRRPIWLLGVALSGVSGLFHAVALGRGSLIEVESIMVTSLLFALGLGIVVSGLRVSTRDWLGASATIIGLVAFLVFADPQDGDYTITARTALIGIGVFAVVMAALVVIAVRSTRPNTRAALFGAAAAVSLGSAAVVLKVIDSELAGHAPIRTLLPAIAFLDLCGLSAPPLPGVTFRQGSLAAALAPFIGGNPLVAGTVGIVIFGERFHRSLGDVAGSLAGIGLVVAGIVILASSPLVAAGSGETPASGEDLTSAPTGGSGT